MGNLIVHLSGASIRQQAKVVLADVGLKISKGEFVYLVGRTGSGKSSLLKTIYAALALEEGRGEVADFDLRGLNRHTIPLLRRKLIPFHLTVFFKKIPFYFIFQMIQLVWL